VLCSGQSSSPGGDSSTAVHARKVLRSEMPTVPFLFRRSVLAQFEIEGSAPSQVRL
jgi:hypothetical protein